MARESISFERRGCTCASRGVRSERTTNNGRLCHVTQDPSPSAHSASRSPRRCSSPSWSCSSVPPDPQDRSEELEEVVRHRHTRRPGRRPGHQISSAAKSTLDRIPHPNDFTAEGLMSEHDLVLPAAADVPSALLPDGRRDALRPDRRARRAIPGRRRLRHQHRRKDLAARSGQPGRGGRQIGLYDGGPLALVRKSLAEMAEATAAGRPDEHRSLWRSRPRAPGTDAGRRGMASPESCSPSPRSRAMDRRRWRPGYASATPSPTTPRPRSRAARGCVLFTDERPNTDATDAASFMGMADRAFGTRMSASQPWGSACSSARSSPRRSAACAAAICTSSATRTDVKDLFTGQLDYMVSELAHDLTLTISAPGRSQDFRCVRRSRRAARLAGGARTSP